MEQSLNELKDQLSVAERSLLNARHEAEKITAGGSILKGSLLVAEIERVRREVLIGIMDMVHDLDLSLTKVRSG